MRAKYSEAQDELIQLLDVGGGGGAKWDVGGSGVRWSVGGRGETRDKKMETVDEVSHESHETSI